MTKNTDVIVHPNHIEMVDYYEDPQRLTWYMMDNFIHISKVTIINQQTNDQSNSKTLP